MRRTAGTLLLLVPLLLAACSSGDGPSAEGSPTMSMSMPGSMGGQGSSGDDTSAFGMPGQEADVDRTIEISQFDTFRFEPASVSVSVGETVMFEVTNQGTARHEFVIGDDAFQADHETEMVDSGGMAMADEPSAITVEPGETKSVIWTFSEPGTFKYGCHVSGHYAAGMVGTIDVM